MKLSINTGSIPWLLIVWAFYLGLGLPAFVWGWPFALLVVGTLLYLIAFTRTA